MKKWLPVLLVVALTVVTPVAAAPSTKPKPTAPKYAFAAVIKITDKTAGKVLATATLRVNGRRQPVRWLKASFIPMDEQGNTCGSYLTGRLSVAVASLTAPHPGANRLRLVLVARSSRPIAGKYYTSKPMVRLVALGGSDYECTHVSSPPPSNAVCAYVFTNPAPGVPPCGKPVPGAPFWATGPTLTGNTVHIGHPALSGGYCWASKTMSTERLTWFGGEVTYLEAWACSNKLTLVPFMYAYLTAPGQDGEPECQAGGVRNGAAVIPWGGDFIRFTVPMSVGGRLDIEWGFDIFASGSTTDRIGSEWSDASFHLTGTQDGCQLLTTPGH